MSLFSSRLIGFGIAFCWAASVQAGLLAEDEAVRAIAFTVRDSDKPMLAAKIAGKNGVLMLDNGTPDVLFLNRNALPLPKGDLVAKGSAASGQAIEVQAHPSPTVEIAGQRVAVPERIRSGDFGFTASGLGDDFLGFIGSPMLEKEAFLLNYPQRTLWVFKVASNGDLQIGSPAERDVLVRVPFFMWPGEQPTVVASVGALPILLDFDTGDSGTLYLSPASRRQLIAQGQLKPDGERWILSGLQIAGVTLNPSRVHLLEAGGAKDFRKTGQGDQLRLGANFLATHFMLWNFPAKTLTVLKPDAALLKRLPLNTGKTQ